jgi:hypothetical protein
MKIIKLLSIIAIALFTLVAHAQYKQSGGQKEVLEVRLDGIGKCPPDIKIRSGRIERKYITSALYVYLGNTDKTTPIPINDKVFNYEYFDKYIYPDMKNKTVKIKVEKYSSNGKDVYVAYEIE